MLAFNPSTWEAEPSGSVSSSHPGPHSETLSQEKFDFRYI